MVALMRMDSAGQGALVVIILSEMEQFIVLMYAERS